MKRTLIFLALAMMVASPCLIAQSASMPFSVAAASPAAGEGYAPGTFAHPAQRIGSDSISPFSRLAFAGGISPIGINLQAAMNANRRMNIRGVGNIFTHSMNNFTTNGMSVNGDLNFATLGIEADVYPFPEHDFRLSPGLLLLNHNALTANVAVPGGSSFDLNGVTYYASSTNPITGNGRLGFNARNPAFTMTTGWGNIVSHRGRRLSFPFEVGAAFVGVPSVSIALTGGQACDQFGQNCVNAATDPTVQANLAAQIQKYKNDMKSLQYFPIVSFGVAYNFNLRPESAVR